jgi:hypothetical protein
MGQLCSNCATAGGLCGRAAPSHTPTRQALPGDPLVSFPSLATRSRGVQETGSALLHGPPSQGAAHRGERSVQGGPAARKHFNSRTAAPPLRFQVAPRHVLPTGYQREAPSHPGLA